MVTIEPLSGAESLDGGFCNKEGGGDMNRKRRTLKGSGIALLLAVVVALGIPQNVMTVRADKEYSITATAAAGGMITDDQAHRVKEGEDKTYHIYPDKGYRVNYVTVDGENIGAVTEYTFKNVKRDHEIRAYFISGSSAVVTKKKLSVVGSFSLESGAGTYAPDTKVTVDAGTMAGFSFAGWIASDGKVYPSAKTTITMPNYDLILNANWMADGTPGALNQAATTNLKGAQEYGWAAIARRIATITPQELQSGTTLEVSTAGFNCYVNAATIAALNIRQGVALNVSYGSDLSFTFYSDYDNSLFAGTELSYNSTTKSTSLLHEKEISFAEQGPIGTGICANVLLPEAVPGQSVYVYLVDAKGNESLYMPAVVDESKKISVPLAAKVNFKVKY